MNKLAIIEEGNFYTEIASPVLKASHSVTVFVTDIELAKTDVLECLPEPHNLAISGEDYCRLFYHEAQYVLTIIHLDSFWEFVTEVGLKTEIAFGWFDLAEPIDAFILNRAKWHNSHLEYDLLPQPTPSNEENYE